MGFTVASNWCTVYRTVCPLPGKGEHVSESAVAKKNTGKSAEEGKPSKPVLTKQLNVRVPSDLYDRLEEAAVMLATDSSHLLRMMIAEKLPEYEERGRRARGLEEAE